MNNWREIYQSKLTTANEAIKFIHDGDKVVTGFGCGEPFGIERALVENYENYHDVEIISMLTLGDSPWCRPEMKGHFKLNCLFASQSNRKAISLGVSEFTTSHFYEIPDLIKNYICPKVAIVMVSPPDEHGYVSFGTTVDYTRGTADYCDIIIAQVNKYMPRTFGNSFMHVRDFTCFVECNEPLPEVKSVDISETEMEIGKYCASLIKEKSLQEIIKNVALKNKDDLLASKVKLDVNVNNIKVLTDAKWLEFILNQIINNSIKYKRNNVESYIKIIAKEDKEKTYLSIYDNGIGIPKKDIPRVFEKSFTGENGRIIAKSTGMGLYIVKKLCDKLGHKINIESKKKEYTS